MDAIVARRRVRSASLSWPLIGSKTACASENNAWISSVFLMLMETNECFRRMNYTDDFARGRDEFAHGGYAARDLRLPSFARGHDE